MFAQATTISLPEGGMPRLRQLLETQYLPDLQGRDGFVSAMLLEQIDDPESAILLVLWRNQQAVETLHQTGALQASVRSLGAALPGLNVTRAGYVVTLQETAALATPVGAAVS